MSDELLEFDPPRELKFIVEVKKQSSCSVRLYNKSNYFVAFKVKTTNPKKYVVRPNTGIIKPKSTHPFQVIMQAPKVPPTDMTSRDKFLIQSTAVSTGTTEEDITSGMFAKDNDKYVGERKLRVILISPPNSPIPSPMSGVPGPSAYDTPPSKNSVFHRDDETSPQSKVTQGIVDPQREGPAAPLEALAPEHVELIENTNTLKEKKRELETKLKEAHETISKLTEARATIARDRENLQHEMELIRSNKAVKRVQVGFSFLYVCMVVCIFLTLGYLIRCL